MCLLAGDGQTRTGSQSKMYLVLLSLFLIFSILVPQSNGGFIIIETEPKPGGVKDTKEKKTHKRFDFSFLLVFSCFMVIFSGLDYFYHHDSSEYYDAFPSCPDNWKTLATGCYYFEENPMTWDKAKRFCSNLGAKMVVVESDDERNGIT